MSKNETNEFCCKSCGKTPSQVGLFGGELCGYCMIEKETEPRRRRQLQDMLAQSVNYRIVKEKHLARMKKKPVCYEFIPPLKAGEITYIDNIGQYWQCFGHQINTEADEEFFYMLPVNNSTMPMYPNILSTESGKFSRDGKYLSTFPGVEEIEILFEIRRD